MRIFAVLTVGLLMISCSKDDPKPMPIIIPLQQLIVEGQSIMGKWYYKETIINGTTIPYDDNETCGKDYLEFYSQTKVRRIDVFDCQEDVDFDVDYTKMGNVLTLSSAQGSRTVEITELNPDTFAYKYEYDDNGDGNPERYTERFTRQ